MAGTAPGVDAAPASDAVPGSADALAGSVPSGVASGGAVDAVLRRAMFRSCRFVSASLYGVIP